MKVDRPNQALERGVTFSFEMTRILSTAVPYCFHR